MEHDTRPHGWRAAACGAALAALAATGCVSEPPAPASEDAEEAAEAMPAVRGAHEAFDNPQETFTDERGLTVESLPVDAAPRRYPGLGGLSDPDRRWAIASRISRWPISTAS